MDKLVQVGWKMCGGKARVELIVIYREILVAINTRVQEVVEEVVEEVVKEWVEWVEGVEAKLCVPQGNLGLTDNVLVVEVLDIAGVVQLAVE